MNNPTLNRVVDFLTTYAMGIMIGGMVVTGVSFFFFMRFRFYGEPLRTILFSLAIVGVVIYFIGRVSLAYGRRARTRAEKPEPDSSDPDNSR